MPLIFSLLILAFSTEPGGPVMTFLKTGQGARGAALGEANIGLADDPSAVYFNPGGLGGFSEYALSFSHQVWNTSTSDEMVHTVLPTARGALGIGLFYSSNRRIEFWDETNTPGDTFSTSNALLFLGSGFKLGRNYFLGVGVKGCLENLYQSYGYGGGVDLGILARPFPFLGAGITVRNFGLGKYSSELYPLPAELGAGVAYTQKRLTAVLDLIKTFGPGLDLRGGIEYAPVQELALRMGYRTGPEDLNTLGYFSGLTAGLGINLGRIGIDYSFTPYGALGWVHRFTLHLNLPRHGSGTLRIRVIDRATAEPIRALLKITGVRAFHGGTNRKGELLLTGLPRGELVINTENPGYLSRTDTMLILGDREQLATIGLQPIRKGAILGTIYDSSTGKPLTGSVVYRGPVSGEAVTDPTMGTFAIRDLPSGRYTLTARGQANYAPSTCTLNLEADKLLTHDFHLSKSQTKTLFQDINFEPGSAEIQPEFIAVLDRAGLLLQQNPGMVVELAGHTDPSELNVGAFSSHRELALARAEAVRKYLIEKFGIATERLVARGYADTQPLAPNDTESGRAKNRRTEFRILKR